MDPVTAQYLIPVATTVLSGIFGNKQQKKAQALQREQMNQQFQLQQQAFDRADEFGLKAEQAFADIPTYQTPDEFLAAMEEATRSRELGVSRVDELSRLLEDRRTRPLTGYAEGRLTEGIQRTEQNLQRLARTTGTRDIYGSLDVVSQQASRIGELAEQQMETQEQQYISALPQMSAMEQQLSGAYQGALQTLGGQRAMEQQSESAKQQQLFNFYAGAASGQAQFGQSMQLQGMANQSQFNSANLQASSLQSQAMIQGLSNVFSNMYQAGAFNPSTTNSTSTTTIPTMPDTSQTMNYLQNYTPPTLSLQ